MDESSESIGRSLLSNAREGRKHDEQPRTSKSESATDKETERTKQHRIRMEDQSDQNDQNDRPNDEEEFEDQNDRPDDEEEFEDQNDQNDQNDEEEFKVCQGLTDEERRKIRKEQRLLRSNIPDLDVDEARKRNNEIFENVRYVRESVLDAENINDIVKKAGIKIEQMIKAPRYDADRVVSKLIEQCRVTKGGNSYFDWRSLGIQAGVCFNAVPARISFLNGPLVDGKEEAAVKQRAKRVRKTQTDSDAEEEQPEDVKGHTARGADKLSAVEKNIKDVNTALTQKVKRNYALKKQKLSKAYGDVESIPERVKKRMKKNTEVCAIELLFNPKSFTQTVENLYHYSFLVKEGAASLNVRDEKVLDKEKGFYLDGGPVVRNVTKKEVNATPRQAIVSLTMEDWKDLIEAYDVQSSDVPHREP